MNDNAPNDTGYINYPPGHPAGADDFISTGEVLSGRGIGTAGVLAPLDRISEETALPPHNPSIDPPTGPTVLIAVDGASRSEHIVRAAHRLFGEAASYLAINVGKGPSANMSWDYVWPVQSSSSWMPARAQGSVEESVDSDIAGAANEASVVTRQAGLSQATPLGDVGDPTTAIIRAAHHHHADVVVIGVDARSWMSHLIHGSVEHDLLVEADFAVLVVDAGTPGARP